MKKPVHAAGFPHRGNRPYFTIRTNAIASIIIPLILSPLLLPFILFIFLSLIRFPLPFIRFPLSFFGFSLCFFGFSLRFFGFPLCRFRLLRGCLPLLRL